MATNLHSLRRYTPLLIIIVLGLFPYGWLAAHWQRFDAFTGALFPTALAHAIGHTSLFIIMGAALLAFFPKLRQQPLAFFGIMLLLGLCQEAFQLAYKQRPLEFDELRDLITDMLGSLVAWLWFWHRSRT